MARVLTLPSQCSPFDIYIRATADELGHALRHPVKGEFDADAFRGFIEAGCLPWMINCTYQFLAMSGCSLSFMTELTLNLFKWCEGQFQEKTALRAKVDVLEQCIEAFQEAHQIRRLQSDLVLTSAKRDSLRAQI